MLVLRSRLPKPMQIKRMGMFTCRFLRKAKQDQRQDEAVGTSPRRIPCDSESAAFVWTVATSLPRSFDLDAIKDLYHLRWGIETSFRDLKYTLGLVNLHGKSDNFAKQEIYAGLTAFNFASRVCQDVVIRQPKDGAYAYKINFKMAVMLCKEYIRADEMDDKKLIEEISRHSVPIRPGRQGQRNLSVKGFPGFVYRVAA